MFTLFPTQPEPLYGLAHSELNAKLLPIVLEEYGKSVYKTLAKLCEVVKIGGKDNREKRKTLSAHYADE